MSGAPYARNLGVVSCMACGMVCADEEAACDNLSCPRCHSALCRRRPNSVGRAAAFLLAGMICYLPANLLPVMYTSRFGRGNESTILSGVLEFWHDGAWDIALLIFVASVAVPCTKFLAMSLLLYTGQRRSTWAMVERARLYRLVELIGYWSMLDVLVVALVAALVQFKSLSYAEPRVGILFFGLVVIFTMLSTLSFDPRLIWDGETPDERHT
ncbi:paraquat-inducible protein A [Chitinimonas sp.]|uniref:paraquat-inducible protein A n=1 Tax=Chitinimonas sp. TaxID=1934313 RepID=UPI002F92429B